MVDSSLFPEYINHLQYQPDRIILNSNKIQYSLQISLKNQQCTKLPKHNHKNTKSVKQFVSLYGIIRMEKNKYLVVVQKSIAIGQIMKKIIFKVQKLQFICLNYQQAEIDKQYIVGLRTVLDNNSLYYSFQYDLTQSLQKFVQGNCNIGNYRYEYMYNSVWIQQLIAINAIQWVTAFISGLVIINFTELSSFQTSQLALITRRDKRRQGLRYLTRGANLDGHTANSCQTEIILSIQQKQHQQYLSHVQLRGSFPFLWSQAPDLKFTPTCKIYADNHLNMQVANKCFKYIQQQYGQFTLVNLVDKKGFQKQLGNQLDRIFTQSNKQGMQLIWFDFHKECKGMKQQNLARLLDKISLNLHDYGYFHLQHSEKNKLYEIKKQEGIVRTNCVDCLDRTNVVQSVIAKKILLKWLCKFKIVKETAHQEISTKLPRSMQHIFKDQWIQNAHILSQLYSGTFAMKTDVTRFGKRTLNGALQDGRIGTQRYLLGNFYDSRKQDYIHLSLNQIKPDVNQNQRIRHSKINSLYVVSAFTIILPLIAFGVSKNFLDNQQYKEAKIAGITVMTLAVAIKSVQLLKSLILHKPIPIQ